MRDEHELRNARSYFSRTNVLLAFSFLLILLVGFYVYLTPRLEQAKNSYVVAIAAGYHAAQEAHREVFGKYAMPGDEIGLAFPRDINAYYDRASMSEQLKDFLPAVQPIVNPKSYLVVLVWKRDVSERVWILESKDSIRYVGELPIVVKPSELK